MAAEPILVRTFSDLITDFNRRSVAYALAGELRLKLCALSLTNPKLTDNVMADLLQRTPLHWTVGALFIGIFVALLFTTLITLKWKISAHMVGIGGVLGAICGLTTLHGLNTFFVIAGLILVAGILGTMRLLITDHTPAQIYAGTALGVACTYASVIFGIGS